MNKGDIQYKKIFANSADAIFIVEHDKIITCNKAACRLFEVPKSQILMSSFYSYSPDKHPKGMDTVTYWELKKKQAKKIGFSKFKWIFLTPEHEQKHVEIMMTFMKLGYHKVFHVVCRDCQDRREYEERLEYLSVHDELTGLYNRRYVEENKCRFDLSENYPISITMADINGLKLVNDSLGHMLGDAYIKRVACVLEEVYAEGHIISRLSGDEFVIISPNVTHEEALQYMEALKERTKTEYINGIEISISCGTDTKYHDNVSFEKVFQTAEAKMYERKLVESPDVKSKVLDHIMNDFYYRHVSEEEHAKRVAELCGRMGEALKLEGKDLENLKLLGLFHDIGLIMIPDQLLQKDEKLSTEEKKEVQQHPEAGYRILSTIHQMSDIAEYILAHHERWDGGGYPKGLKGDEIPLFARVLSIAEAYDAMVCDRSYHAGVTKHEAFIELLKHRGKQFDPELVDLFVEVMEKDV